MQGALAGRSAAFVGKTLPCRPVKEYRLVAHAAKGKPKEEELAKKSDEQKKEGGDDKKGGAVAKVYAVPV